ncbi:hypothetical protein LSH36_626g01002 [Paralvinella palmiformis]|uniref:Uncharacterized protein n=1 Tax=Paralvinella palmiformis TaxID=53620 RepID=A0AAD9J3V7_9ANNE|nr:hypothetical protein LSH36_626g01002 [Paralvinella palmiformis]
MPDSDVGFLHMIIIITKAVSLASNWLFVTERQPPSSIQYHGYQNRNSRPVIKRIHIIYSAPRLLCSKRLHLSVDPVSVLFAMVFFVPGILFTELVFIDPREATSSFLDLVTIDVVLGVLWIFEHHAIDDRVPSLGTMRQALRIRGPSIHPHQAGNSTSGSGNNRGNADSARTRESVKPEDILLSIKEFSHTTAMYQSQLLALGSIKDCCSLRDNLRQTRRRACELAKKNKGLLLPNLRENMLKKVEKTDVERMWNMFATCLELLHLDLLRSLSLLRSFPMHLESCILIQTGLADCPANRKKYSQHKLDTPDREQHISQDQGDIEILKSDIQDITTLLRDIQDKVDIKPWTFEPGQETSKMYESRIGESNSDVDVESTTSLVRPALCTCRKLKGVRLVLVVLFAVLIAASILGVCLALYT